MSEEAQRLRQILRDSWQESASLEGFEEEFEEVDTVELGSDRWHRHIGVVLQSISTRRYYMFYYHQGLTGYQMSDYPDNPIVEVQPVEVTKTQWISVNDVSISGL